MVVVFSDLTFLLLEIMNIATFTRLLYIYDGFICMLSSVNLTILVGKASFWLEFCCALAIFGVYFFLNDLDLV